MNSKVMMLIASIVGAFAGIYFIDITKPAMDFSYWLGAFAILGVGVGNLALLVLYKIYLWLNQEPVSNNPSN
jgi:hypothetical protein